MKYRKLPVEIEAFQYDGDLVNRFDEYYVPEWAWDAYRKDIIFYGGPGELYIKTLEGVHYVSVGDYIIKGVKGELYPCKPDIFEQTYQPVNEMLPEKELAPKENPVIENNFKYHAPTGIQPETYAAIREKAKEFAYYIDEVAPDSREKSLAMTKLEEAVMWANAAIARNG